MSQMKKVLHIYLFVLLLSVVAYACCEENHRIVGNGQISAQNLETEEIFDDEVVGTITGPFWIEVHHQTVMASSPLDVNPISTAYATSCIDNFENDLDISTLSISTDQPFTYDGTAVEAGSNWTDIADLDYDAGFGGIFLRVEEPFLNKLEMTEEVYTFRFQVETTDGLTLQNSIRLQFELD